MAANGEMRRLIGVTMEVRSRRVAVGGRSSADGAVTAPSEQGRAPPEIRIRLAPRC